MRLTLAFVWPLGGNARWRVAGAFLEAGRVLPCKAWFCVGSLLRVGRCFFVRARGVFDAFLFGLPRFALLEAVMFFGTEAGLFQPARCLRN